MGRGSAEAAKPPGFRTGIGRPQLVCGEQLLRVAFLRCPTGFETQDRSPGPFGKAERQRQADRAAPDHQHLHLLRQGCVRTVDHGAASAIGAYWRSLSRLVVETITAPVRFRSSALARIPRTLGWRDRCSPAAT